MKNRPDTNNPGTWRFDPPSPTATPDESPEALLSRAASLHQSGQFELAEPLYRQLLAIQPDNGDALHLLGVLRYQQRDPAAAVPLIEAALKIIPANIHAHTGLGLALLRLGRVEEALASFDRALEIKPDNAEALSKRGEALQALGQPKEALAAYNRSLRYRPNHAETLNNRAAVLIETGRPGEALTSLDQALALVPGYLEALNNRATALNALERYAEALRACDEALAIRSDISQLHNTRGAVLRNLGRREEAVAAFRTALIGQPEAADIHANLGVTLQEMGEAELAEKHLRQALATRPGAVLYQSLAIALYQLKRSAEAMALYQQWLDLEPDNPIPVHMLAAGNSEAVPARASDAYVAKLFDGFADSFESTLIGLGYQMPQVLTSLIRAELDDKATPLRILDAGCGTGLAAPLLKPLASQLVGVDLSAGMLAKARERALYDELVVGELCAFMASRPAAFDLIILADTLVYFGDLEDAFRAAHGALAPGGIFAIALEARPADPTGPDYKLEPHGRYSHRPDYVTRLLAAGGFSLRKMDDVVIRRELHADVTGIAVLARKAP
jgi:predicted TPR repeat methyltransferase